MSLSQLSLEEGRAHLRNLLKERAILRGQFLLASGKESHLYVDVRRVSLDPEGAFWIGRLFTAILASHPEIAAVGGPTLGADPLVSATVLLSLFFGRKLQGFLVRKEAKEHGLRRALEGAPLPEGTRVAILEDVITSGSSVLRALELVEQEGLKVELVLAVLDREEGGGERIAARGYEFQPLFRLSELL